MAYQSKSRCVSTSDSWVLRRSTSERTKASWPPWRCGGSMIEKYRNHGLVRVQ